MTNEIGEEKDIGCEMNAADRLLRDIGCWVERRVQ